MQFFVDFLPVIVFFIAYKAADIYVAVIATAITSCLTVGFTWYRVRRLEAMQITSLVIICIAAALTLLFHDDSFIKWKPTIINGLFAVVFAGSLLTRSTLAERLFSTQMDCPPSVWKKMTIAWVCFFIVCATANYYVAFIYEVERADLNSEQHQEWQAIATSSELYATVIHQNPIAELSETEQSRIRNLLPSQRQHEYLRKVHQSRWVDFKLFGLLALTLLFVLGQGIFIARYINNTETNEQETDNNLSNIL